MNRPAPVHRCHKCREILWPVLSKSRKAILLDCKCGLARRVKRSTFNSEVERASWAYEREISW